MATPKDAQLETLEDLSEAVNYNHWIYGMLRPHLGKRILEIGCGTGNITGHLSQHGKVLAVDTHEGYLAEARKRLKGMPKVAFRKVDLEKQISSLRSFRPDTIVCVNVLERLSGDRRVLSHCFDLLPPRGPVPGLCPGPPIPLRFHGCELRTFPALFLTTIGGKGKEGGF